VIVIDASVLANVVGDDESAGVPARRRFPVGPLMLRAFDLRANVTAYDACYIVRAEALDCTLVTSDQRLASVLGISCSTEVLRQ
jgi:predicted nucleic acid-binding protein